MRERAKQEAQRDEAERDAGQRRQQRGARCGLSDALGHEGAGKLDDARGQRGEQAGLPRHARRIRNAGALRERFGRQHDQEHVGEERHRVDAVGKRADIVTSSALRQTLRLKRVGNIADED